MKISQWIPSIALASLMMGGAIMPSVAVAQRGLDQELKHRQKTKNDWRNLGYAGGALGLYGLLKGDKNLAVIGLGGGLYSAYRYEQDRKSQSNTAQARARFFSRRSFDYNGKHYVRREVVKNGHRYYQFAPSRQGPKPGHHDRGHHYGQHR